MIEPCPDRVTKKRILIVIGVDDRSQVTKLRRNVSCGVFPEQVKLRIITTRTRVVEDDPTDICLWARALDDREFEEIGIRLNMAQQGSIERGIGILEEPIWLGCHRRREQIIDSGVTHRVAESAGL